MLNLFNHQYTEEVDLFKACGQIHLAVPHKFHIIVVNDYGYIYLKDEHNIRWAYAKNGWEIKVPNFYCSNLPIGKHTINNETFIRVSNPELILNKINKYLAPYILHHIWKKNIYFLNINWLLYQKIFIFTSILTN